MTYDCYLVTFQNCSGVTSNNSIIACSGITLWSEHCTMKFEKLKKNIFCTAIMTTISHETAFNWQDIKML